MRNPRHIYANYASSSKRQSNLGTDNRDNHFNPRSMQGESCLRRALCPKHPVLNKVTAEQSYCRTSYKHIVDSVMHTA